MLCCLVNGLLGLVGLEVGGMFTCHLGVLSPKTSWLY